jgi:hypothetical protein
VGGAAPSAFPGRDVPGPPAGLLVGGAGLPAGLPSARRRASPALIRSPRRADSRSAIHPANAALLPIRERVLGPEHPDTLTARASLAYWAEKAGGGHGSGVK